VEMDEECHREVDCRVNYRRCLGVVVLLEWMEVIFDERGVHGLASLRVLNLGSRAIDHIRAASGRE
jgi:hypothetical protein